MSKEKELGIGLLTGLAELPIYPLNFIKVLMQVMTFVEFLLVWPISQ